MKLNKILILVAFCMALPITAENTVDTKIAKLVGKDNVGTVKKVAVGIVITAIALPVIYFATRAALKPCLKYDTKQKEVPAWEFSAPTTPLYILQAGGKLTKDQLALDRQGTVKAFFQKFFRIKAYDKNGTAITENWKSA